MLDTHDALVVIRPASDRRRDDHPGDWPSLPWDGTRDMTAHVLAVWPQAWQSGSPLTMDAMVDGYRVMVATTRFVPRS